MNFSLFLNECLKTCPHMQERAFKKGETITSYIEGKNQVCILISGEADLLQYDLDGNKTIIKHYGPQTIFGDPFYPSRINNELFVLAKTKCNVLIFSYNILFDKCKPSCKFHGTVKQEISNLVLKEIKEQNLRIEILAQKNIRAKLLAYFEILADQKHSREFLLPFTMSDLASFLNVDRSAMTRELGYLKKENKLKQKGREITLL